MPAVDAPRGNNAAARSVVKAAPKAPPSAPARALQAFHTEEAQSHVPSVSRRNVQMGERAAAKLPQRYVAQTPQATATQAFHTEEAQSHVPSVARANELRGELAVAGKADQAAEARHKAALALIEAHHSGGLGLGVITNPLGSAASFLGHEAKGIGDIAATAGRDIVGLGPAMLQAGETWGSAILHDLGHPSTWGFNHLGGAPTGSATSAIVKGMAGQDPVVAALEGEGPGSVLHTALHNPVNTILDAAGGAGLAARGAGMAARAGVLGSRAAQAADLTRAPRVLAPGVLEPQVYSRNMLVSAGQKALESRPALQSKYLTATGRGAERMLRQRAVEHNQVVSAVRQEVGAAAERAARKQGYDPNKTLEAVRKSQAAATRMLHDEFVQRHSLGVSKTARGARAMRTIRTKSGAIPMETKVVGAVTKRSVPSEWPNRVVPEAFKNADIAAEYHLLPKNMVDTLNRYHPRQVSMVGDTPIFHQPALTIPKGLPGAGNRIGTPQFTRWFRNSVLPFSSKWVLGNVAEAGMRSALAGAHAGDYRLANQVLKEMEHSGKFREATYLRAHTLGGAHGAFQERLYQDKAGATGPWTRLGKAGHMYNRNIERIFAGNRKVEQQFSQAVLGRHMRAKMAELRGVSREDRIKALAREYSKPEVAAQAGRYSRKTLGKYDAFAPGVQSFIRHAAPFGPWYGNAAKFIYRDMPFKHPLITSGALATHNATFPAWEKAHSSNNPNSGNKVLGVPFGSLMYALKTGKASYEDLGRYTPFGAVTNGPIGAAMSPLFPQYQTPIANIFGKDAFLQDLQAPGPSSHLTPTGRVSKASKHRIDAGTMDALLTALSNFAGQEAGPLNQAHRVAVDQGSTPYNTEKLWDLNPKMKPGTAVRGSGIVPGLNRVFNPFFPIVTQPKKHKASVTHKAFPSIRGLPSFGGGGGGGGLSSFQSLHSAPIPGGGTLAPLPLDFNHQAWLNPFDMRWIPPQSSSNQIITGPRGGLIFADPGGYDTAPRSAVNMRFSGPQSLGNRTKMFAPRELRNARPKRHLRRV